MAINGASLLLPVRVSLTSVADWEVDRVSRFVLPLTDRLKLLLRGLGTINESSDLLLIDSEAASFDFSKLVVTDGLSGSIAI